MKEGDLWTVSFPKAGEPGKGEERRKVVGQAKQTGRNPAGGAARQSKCVVCWWWCHLLPWVCWPLGTRSHQKLQGFVAKLPWAKQVNPAFCLGYTQAHLGKRTHMDGQAASDCTNDEGPLKHASKKLHSMRSAPLAGGSSGGGGSRGQLPQ